MKCLLFYLVIIIHSYCLFLQAIDCIVTPGIEEHELMKKITEEEDDIDTADVVVESWLKRHKEGRLIRFDKLYQQDIQALKITARLEIAGAEDIPAVGGQELPSLVSVVEMIEKLDKKIVDQLNDIITMILDLNGWKHSRMSRKQRRERYVLIFE